MVPQKATSGVRHALSFGIGVWMFVECLSLLSFEWPIESCFRHSCHHATYNFDDGTRMACTCVSAWDAQTRCRSSIYKARPRHMFSPCHTAHSTQSAHAPSCHRTSRTVRQCEQTAHPCLGTLLVLCSSSAPCGTALCPGTHTRAHTHNTKQCHRCGAHRDRVVCRKNSLTVYTGSTITPVRAATSATNLSSSRVFFRYLPASANVRKDNDMKCQRHNHTLAHRLVNSGRTPFPWLGTETHSLLHSVWCC